jgi:hypothetical protein
VSVAVSSNMVILKIQVMGDVMMCQWMNGYLDTCIFKGVINP